MKHKHHIIPKHTGGTDDPSNIVLLTVEEHAEAHKQLWLKYGRWQDKLAWQGLAKILTKQELVEALVTHKNKDMKKNALRGEKHPYYGKKRPEHSKIMKEWAKTYVKTEEHKEKLKKACIEASRGNECRALGWKIIINNETKIITNLKKFCRENGIVYSTLYTRGKSNGCELVGKV